MSRVIAFILIVLFATCATWAGDLEQELFDAINQQRTAKGLNALEWSEVLANHARAHSQAMKQAGKLSHDGVKARFRRIMQELGADLKLAENVSMNNFSKQETVSISVQRWMQSPRHRSNLMGEYKTTGVGVAQAEDGRIYYTQIYGK